VNKTVFLSHKDFLALLFIVLMALVYVSPGFLFPGKSFGPLSNLYTWSPWNLTQIGTQSPKGNELLNDQILQFIPWREYTVANMRKGMVPLWNPYQYCGSPFLGNSQSAPFYPINLLTLYLNIKWYLIVSAFLKLVIAGSGMYVFIRLSGLSSVSSLWSGISFMFMGFNIIWLGHPHTQTFVWIPWILASLRYWNRSPNGLSMGLLGICTGIAFLGGHPETIFMTGLILILYSIFLATQTATIPLKIKYLAGVMGALAIGISIASIQLLPTLDYLSQSSTLKVRLGWKPLIDFQGKRALITWLLPDFFGNPLLYNAWVKDDLFFQFNFAEASSGYIGFLPLLMISGLFIYRKWNWEVIFWSIVALLGLLIAYRVPLIGPFCANLPGLSLIHPKRLVILISISLIILSAQGVDSFLHQGKSPGKINPLQYMIISLVLLAIISLVPFFKGVSFSTLVLEKLGISIAKMPMDSLKLIIQHSLNVFCVHLLAGIVALSALIGIRRNLVACNIILICCISTEMFYFGWGYNLGYSVKEFPPSHPLKSFLAEDPTLYRIVSLDEWTIYPPNSSMLDKLYDVRGYDAIVPQNYEQYFRIMNLGFWKDTTPRLWSDFSGDDQVSLKLLGMMNVKYLLCRKPFPLSNAPLVFQETDLGVYKNPFLLPRAFIVPLSTISKKDNITTSILTSNSFNPAKTVILDGMQEEISFQKNLSPTPKVIINYLLPNTIKMNISHPVEGFLFISENYFRGWKAYADGKKTPIYKANGCFMSVKLDKPCHEVMLTYGPLSYIIGKILSIIGCLCCLLLIINELYLRKKKLI
jgi:hypothetical protein